MDHKHAYSPEEAQAVREAYNLARRTFKRRLTNEENSGLAKAVMELAATGCVEVDRLATRAVIRVLR
jgi:hypothetical protein